MNFIKKLFNKKKNVEEVYEDKVDIPSLLEEESFVSSKVNLMADPIVDNKPVTEEVIRKPSLIESPSIEKQLLENVTKDEIELPKEEEQAVSNAFNMSPIVEKDEIETLDVNLQKTQKFCPDCGTANDVLNKFCVSCGYNFN